VYHVAAAGEKSWYGFGDAILEQARLLPRLSLTTNKINSIFTQGYPTQAKRPMNSRLATTSLENHFGLLMPAWKKCLLLCMDELYLTGVRI